MPALIVKDGPSAGERYEVDDEVVFGREDAGVTIEDAEMSRKHAVIRAADGGLEIEDLGSLNGTFVNGTKIDAATKLSGGDTVKLGTTTLEVELAHAAETTASAAPSSPAAPPTAVVAPAAPPTAVVAPAAPPVSAPPAEPAPVASAPAPPAPPPARAAPPSEKPSEPFGAFVHPSSAGRGRVATRVFGPTLISWLAVIATAVALALYFSMR